jgi:hypothetical protein
LCKVRAAKKNLSYRCVPELASSNLSDSTGTTTASLGIVSTPVSGSPTLTKLFCSTSGAENECICARHHFQEKAWLRKLWQVATFFSTITFVCLFAADVWAGVWQGAIPVALKRLKASEEDPSVFIKEATVAMYVTWFALFLPTIFCWKGDFLIPMWSRATAFLFPLLIKMTNTS